MMAVSPLHKSLFLVIVIGISFCMFTFLAVNHPQQVTFSSGSSSSGSDELGVLSGRTFSIRVDDVIVHNISDRVIENIKSDTLLCSTLRDNRKQNTIYIITPTYKRAEQIPDLTRLAQTLMHVPSILWLVIEDAESLSLQVAAILRRSGIRYIHMIAPMPKDQQKKKVKARGVSNRNRGLQWIRENYVDTRGVIYFADDDNTYDLRLFDENSKGKMPYSPGYEEDRFLQSLNIKLSDIEPKADNCTQIYVWHTQTKKNKPPIKVNETVFGGSNIMSLYSQIAY